MPEEPVSRRPSAVVAGNASSQGPPSAPIISPVVAPTGEPDVTRLDATPPASGSSRVRLPQVGVLAGHDTPYSEVVAIGADTLAVASAHSPAPLRIFSAASDGSWREAARFDPLGAGPVDGPVVSVTLSGDRVALAVPYQLSESSPDAAGVRIGAVHLYRQSGGVWSPEAVLWAPPESGRSSFGHSLALSSDELLVGAPHAPGGGAAFVYRRRSDSGAWEPTDDLRGSGDAAELFGWSLALRDDVLVVGAPGNGADGKPGTGAVYVHGRTEPGAFQKTGFLKASDAKLRQLPSCISMGCLYAAKTFERFGESVDLRDGRLAVGAPAAGPRNEQRAENYPWVAGKGAVYLFRQGLASASWVEEGHILSPDASPGFGTVVRLGSGLLVAATPELREEREAAGYAHTGESGTWVFEDTQGTWTSRGLVRAPSEAGARTAAFALDGRKLAVPALAGAPSGGFVEVLILDVEGGP